MAYWTVLGTTTSDADVKYFGVTLDTDANTWTAGGPDVASVFQTRNGGYVIKPAPDLGTSLLDANQVVVALFRGLTGASGVGDIGSGNVYETGKTISWRLDSK